MKAQVLTGGRGKAGGIKLADTPEEAEARAAENLGLDIRGHVVRKLWIEQASDIAREYYLSLTFDRSAKRHCSCSPRRAASTSRRSRPRARRRSSGCTSTRSRASIRGTRAGSSTAPGIGTRRAEAGRGDRREALRGVRRQRGDALRDQPAHRHAGRRGARARAKFTVDDNALFRHPDLAELRDIAAADPLEALHREGVTYVKLDGEVGVLGNGAGLTMATVTSSPS